MFLKNMTEEGSSSRGPAWVWGFDRTQCIALVSVTEAFDCDVQGQNYIFNNRILLGNVQSYQNLRTLVHITLLEPNAVFPSLCEGK